MTVRVYSLQLDRATNLYRAFRVVSDARGVVSCTVEPGLRQIRFVAPVSEADALVERIYLDGGLVWCSRHTARGARSRAKRWAATDRHADPPSSKSVPPALL
jgi:hypothetical protein